MLKQMKRENSVEIKKNDDNKKKPKKLSYKEVRRKKTDNIKKNKKLALEKKKKKKTKTNEDGNQLKPL